MDFVADRYELKESIGYGGMSEVYAATDTLLGREVAVKILKIDLARDENFRERFRREAQNSARLNHPNIVAVYDTGSHVVDGVNVPFIVMERVMGRNLRDIVREDGVLSPRDAAKLMLPVTSALQASHDAGIIHRDVKPANIMVTNTGTVKVMDFGIARALDDATTQMTQTSAVLGTAQYLSPEQARGKLTDARSDIYSLGCVMFEAMTGRPPFEGESPFAVAYQHVQEEPEEPSAFLSDVSPQEAANIDAVILTAMAKNPDDRYSSAAEMGEDLARVARGAVPRAAQRRTPPPAEEPTRVAPAVGAAAATGAAAGSTVAPATTVEPAPASRYDQEREDHARPANSWLKWIAALLALVALGFAGVYAFDYLRNNNEPTITETMVTVPNVDGQERGAAQRQLEELGLQVQVNEEPNPNVPRNHVIRTNPVAGSQLREGTLVTMAVSSGREIADVPDLTGLTAQQAAQALAQADLELHPEVTEATSESVQAGRIVRQAPVAGSPLAKGSQVSIVVSSGREQVQVPSLVGMNAQAAEDTLNSLGLSAQFESVDSDRPEGEVLAVGGAGSRMARGSTVPIQVSNGMVMEMIDITRMTPESARAALEAQEWHGEIEQGEVVGTGALIDDGLISWHNPSEGATMRKDSTVTVRLWQFQASKLLPEGIINSPATMETRDAEPSTSPAAQP